MGRAYWLKKTARPTQYAMNTNAHPANAQSPNPSDGRAGNITKGMSARIAKSPAIS